MVVPVPTVVIVDDAPEIRMLVGMRLRLAGRFDVVGEGADGAEAVALAEAHQPTLMVLDVSMPHVDGLQALPRVLEVSPGTRVVMYSGFEQRGLAERARQLGAVAFLEKSLPIEQLEDRLLDLASQDAEPSAVVGGRDGREPDRKREQEILDEHLERFREIFDEAAIGMGTMTLSGNVVRANRALAEIVQRPTNELVGTPYAELVTGDGTGLADALRRITTGETEVVQVEHGVCAAPGTRVVTTLAAVRGSDGRPFYVFLQVQDMSAQRDAEEQLRRSEQRFRLLVEAVQDYAIFMLDRDGHIVSWNLGAQRAKGYTEAEIVGRHFRVFYPPDKQAERHPEHELELALRDGRYEEEGWRIRKDGSRFWANVVITAVYDDEHRHIGFGKVTRDVTERRQMLDELEDINEQLRRARDDQAEFLAVTAHDLRMPIGVLSGSADTLAKHWDKLGPDDRNEILAAMTTSARRLRRLLADLLTASRVDARAVELHRTQVDVDEVLRAAATAAQRADENARVQVEAADGLVVSADADRLAQAVDNLVSNALTHGRSPVLLQAMADDDMVAIRVTDSGSGVPEELRARLFERFATGEASGGTGLGLFIVRELARVHGGDATYEPPTDHRPAGSFVIRLPRTT